MRFQAGHRKVGGRKKGTPNSATVEIRDFARVMLENPAYRTALKARLISGKAPHMETLLYHYAYGKPREATEDSGQDGVWVSQADIERAASEFDAQVARLIARQGEQASGPPAPS